MRPAPVPVGTEPDDANDIGGHRLRFITTPHLPHNWERGLWFDETTSTLLAGDLLTHSSDGASHCVDWPTATPR